MWQQTNPLSFVFWSSVAGPVMDEEAERDVQPVRLADAASCPPGGADHRQHHGPAGEDHDQQSGQQTGEGARPGQMELFYYQQSSGCVGKIQKCVVEIIPLVFIVFPFVAILVQFS